MTQKTMVVLLLCAQVLLFGYELTAHYDTNGRQLALALTNAGAIGLYLVVQQVLRKRYGIVVHWTVLLIVAVAVWLDAIGNFAQYYAGFWWWDRLTHATGGLAVTAGFYAVTVALWKAGRMKVSWVVVNLYAFAISQTLGALYEVTEWIGDELFATHRVQGPFDSPRDMFFNMAGGLLVLAIGVVWRIRHRAVNPSQHDHA